MRITKYTIKDYTELGQTYQLSGAKLPKMDTLKAEFQRLSADKKKAYQEYREIKKAMQEIVTVKSNIDHLLGLTDTQKNKEMER